MITVLTAKTSYKESQEKTKTKITKIFKTTERMLNFSFGEGVATLHDFNEEGRDVGTIFESLDSQEIIELQEGFFVLDDNLDPEESIEWQQLISLSWWAEDNDGNSVKVSFSLEKAKEIFNEYYEPESYSESMNGYTTTEWVSFELGQPGCLNEYPCVVFNRCSSEHGNVTASTYKYI